MSETDVIVIGAGAAGLAAAHELTQAGLSVRILEREAELGASWRRRHKNLRLNTYRERSTLPEVGFPAGTPAFPPKAAVIAMFEGFVRHHGLAVEHGVAVERIERDGDQWRVTIAGGGAVTARAVVVASGRDRAPWMPQWPGMERFGGRLIHAADFGDSADYAGRSVLVVGAGNSGFDVLNHLIGVKTGPVWLSARHAPAILPKRIVNIAVHQMSPFIAALPVRAADALVSALQWMMFGKLSRYGLPKARAGGMTRLATGEAVIASDEGALAAIKAGRITVVPTVQAFLADGVALSDGRTIHPEVVIVATGYRPGLEGMVGHLGILDARGTPLIDGAESEARLPGLHFIGMRPSIRGDFANARRNARAIAATIARQLRAKKIRSSA